ncbi:HAMP domain-containing histidine kinase [bacterium]|nr:HAMP domain-containing histidine kinase [bacterium]
MNISGPAGRTEKEDENLEIQLESFIASLSHDLKNSTIAQIRALELFLKGGFGQILPKQREILEIVLDSCKYMNAMLSSLLATYRTERGVIKLSEERVSVADLTVECIDEVVFLAKEKGINISVTNSANTETVWGDKIQLKRVVMNLLTNGIKYAYRNSIIKVRVYNEDENTCFCFENNSPYIKPEKQKKIFARYISYANAHHEFGIGLGLYTSKKIVEAHNGTIFVQSFENERNIFGFKIPNSDIYKDAERTVTF